MQTQCVELSSTHHELNVITIWVKIAILASPQHATIVLFQDIFDVMLHSRVSIVPMHHHVFSYLGFRINKILIACAVSQTVCNMVVSLH